MGVKCNSIEPCHSLVYICEGNAYGSKGLALVQMSNFEDGRVYYKLTYRKKAGATTTHQYCMLGYCPGCGVFIGDGFETPGKYNKGIAG